MNFRGQRDTRVGEGGPLRHLGVALIIRGHVGFGKIDPSVIHAHGPRHGQEHDGRSGKGADTDRESLLRFLHIAQSGEEHDGTIGDGAEEGEDDSADEAGEGGDKEEEVGSFGDEVRGAVEDVAVGEEEPDEAGGADGAWFLHITYVRFGLI